MTSDLDAYRKATAAKAWRADQLEGRMGRTDDPAVILALSRKLRTTCRELMQLAQEYVAAHDGRRSTTTPPDRGEGD